eukprot:TRINITY_DN25884_c0_g1_i15.p1 TRINITY_DN25884_c0_g1~~TRINITY_DN25884_c0_g1_i15.p1  ORF type:complete len:674 (-),score=168.68 TRINITY_DN25884_c0_g1_i15:101-2122(-)
MVQALMRGALARVEFQSKMQTAREIRKRKAEAIKETKKLKSEKMRELEKVRAEAQLAELTQRELNNLETEFVVELRRQKAIRKIQAVARGRLARSLVERMRREKRMAKREERLRREREVTRQLRIETRMAIRIQAVWRGRRGRIDAASAREAQRARRREQLLKQKKEEAVRQELDARRKKAERQQQLRLIQELARQREVEKKQSAAATKLQALVRARQARTNYESIQEKKRKLAEQKKKEAKLRARLREEAALEKLRLEEAARTIQRLWHKIRADRIAQPRMADLRDKIQTMIAQVKERRRQEEIFHQESRRRRIEEDRQQAARKIQGFYRDKLAQREAALLWEQRWRDVQRARDWQMEERRKEYEAFLEFKKEYTKATRSVDERKRWLYEQIEALRQEEFHKMVTAQQAAPTFEGPEYDNFCEDIGRARPDRPPHAAAAPRQQQRRGGYHPTAVSPETLAQPRHQQQKASGGPLQQPDYLLPQTRIDAGPLGGGMDATRTRMPDRRLRQSAGAGPVASSSAARQASAPQQPFEDQRPIGGAGCIPRGPNVMDAAALPVGAGAARAEQRLGVGGAGALGDDVGYEGQNLGLASAAPQPAVMDPRYMPRSPLLGQGDALGRGASRVPPPLPPGGSHIIDSRPAAPVPQTLPRWQVRQKGAQLRAEAVAKVRSQW